MDSHYDTSDNDSACPSPSSIASSIDPSFGRQAVGANHRIVYHAAPTPEREPILSEEPPSSAATSVPGSPRSESPDRASDYSLVELTALLPSQATRKISLYIDRSWAALSDLPTTLLLHASSIKKLSGTSRWIPTSSRVTIVTPIALFGGDAEGNDAAQIQNDVRISDGYTGDGSRGRVLQPTLGRWQSFLHRPIAPLSWLVLLSFLSLLWLDIIFASQPVSLPLPLHLPIVHLASSLQQETLSEPDWFDDLYRFGVGLGEACDQIHSWKRAYKDDVPEAGQFWDRVLWSVVDDGEEKLRLPHAEREDMQTIFEMCTDLEKKRKKVDRSLHDIRFSLNFELQPQVQKLALGLASELDDLKEDETRSADLIVPIYLKKMMTREQTYRREYERRVAEAFDSVWARGAHHTRRNPRAWRVERETEYKELTIIQVLEKELDDLNQVSNGLKELRDLTDSLKEELRVHGSDKYKALNSSQITDLQNEVDASISCIRTLSDRTLAFVSTLQYIAWTNGYPSDAGAGSVNTATFDIWTSVWTWSGLIDVKDRHHYREMRRAWFINKYLVGNVLDAFLVRPKLQVMVVDACTQLRQLHVANANNGKS